MRPKIDFEFRFDRNEDAHKNFLEERTVLIKKFCKSESKKHAVKKILLYPVARAGKSGSEVFYLDLFTKQSENPKKYIAKFQNIQKTIEEVKSAKIAHKEKICTKVKYKKYKKNNIGILVYDLAKIENHLEFRSYFLNIENSAENCAKALFSIFKNIGKQPNNEEENHKSFVEDFDWYLHRSNYSVPHIQSFNNCSAKYDGVAKLAKSIYTHYQKTLSQLKALDVKVFPYFIHGDLHARNLMLNANNPNQTELIDFGWVHYGHPAKDFSLMEVTLKYMLLHELLQKICYTSRDIPHLPLIIFEEFEKYLCKHGLSLPAVNIFEQHIKTYGNKNNCVICDCSLNILKRVYVSLIEIRNAAKEVLDQYCEKHYTNNKLTSKQHFLISNFFITLGLSGFSEVEPIWTLIGINITGNSIW